ncbi:leucyl aminopeptidase [bacterium]|nr:leucyl aminopeptidase [bacterium]
MKNLMDTYKIKFTNSSGYKNIIVGIDNNFTLKDGSVALEAAVKSRIDTFLSANSQDKEKKVLNFSLYENGIEQVYLVNVDEKDNATLIERFAAIGQKIRSAKTADIALYAWKDSASNGTLLPAIEGFLLGTYVFKGYKKEKGYQVDFSGLDIVLADAEQTSELTTELDEIKALVSGTFLTRDLVNEPANIINPSGMERVAHDLAQSGEWKIDVLDQQAIIKKGMNLLNSVGMGSVEKPRLVHLSYRPQGAKKTIAIVGKGVTYDTGGYSLKPQNAMYGMKSDMGGAGTCYGVVSAIAKAGIKVNIDVYTPLVENMVSDRATKPGDVFVGYNGRSVEIENTDAEGRLILADALSYAAEQKPDCILDMATLTGAIVIALGDEIFAAFTKEEEIFKGLDAAAKLSAEKVWRMPLEESYKKGLKSDVADCKNVGGRAGGAITAALFLSEFVGDVPWCHLDIAPTAFSDSNSALLPKGGTGNPVRSIYRWLKSQQS